jgi:uncharacterized protein (DUF2147 family)
MRAIVAATLAAVAAMGPGAAQAGNGNVLGTWLTDGGDSKIRVAPCGKTVCATVTWGKTSSLDTNNPDPALRSRNVVGSTLSKNIHPDGDDAWAASMYNPENGKTYDVTLRTTGPDSLEIEGCVLSVLCGSEKWTRLPDATATATSLTPRP